MLIKSSMETLELAFNTAEYCCKKLFKSEEGGRYNKWYCYGAEFGQDYAWFKVEHTDYSVRLSFEFMETGFVYVDGYFTNGSSYDKKTITSWRFDNESEDIAADKVKDVLDRFFDEGINVLRGEEVINSRRTIKSSADNLPSEVYYIVVNGSRQYYEDYDEADDNLETLRAIGKGKVDGVYTETDPDEIYELYEVGYIGNSRRPVESSLENDVHALKDKMENMSGEDITKGIKKTIRRNQKPMLGIKYNVLDQNGGVVGTPMSYEDACDLADDIDGEVVPVYSSRRPVKSSFVVGKTMNDGSKLYYCEDNCFYDENNYTRPSIKIFDNKQEADKIAKRSKSGFVSPLEK